MTIGVLALAAGSVTRMMNRADAGVVAHGARGPAARHVPAVHVVRMMADERGYRNEPADITIAEGDTVAFVMVSGGPHNVAFDSAGLSAAARTALMANMPERLGALSGKLLIQPDERYVVSFAGVPAGTYFYKCLPHDVMGQHGTITVTAR